MRPGFSGTLRGEMHWQPVAPLAQAEISSKELPMRNRILAITALAAAIGAPVAAQAQADVTIGRAPVVVESGPGIAVEQRGAFREYVVRERVPSFTIPDRVVVGAVLPESGVTYYDVPQRFGPTTYRYTVVNGATVLVEPRSRRIVEVMD
jgi:ABC-type nitrate/sulfonate/bicarbonate transport system substrate-binding protein